MMKKSISITLSVIGILLVLGVIMFQYLNYRSALDCTLNWGRLSPFPATKENFSLKIKGGMFTREFVVEFEAPVSEISRWLQASPGTREAIVTNPSPHLRHFEIKPGGGAQFVEVTVDDTTHRVHIRVYWS